MDPMNQNLRTLSIRVLLQFHLDLRYLLWSVEPEEGHLQLQPDALV